MTSKPAPWGMTAELLRRAERLERLMAELGLDEDARRAVYEMAAASNEPIEAVARSMALALRDPG